MLLSSVHAAENRFAYLGEMQRGGQINKNLAVLTLLLSLLVVSCGAHATFLDEFNNSNKTGMQALVYAGFRLLNRLARGLLVSTALYGENSKSLFLDNIQRIHRVRLSGYVREAILQF